MAYIGKSPTGTGVRSRFFYTQSSAGSTSISGNDDDNRTLTFSDAEYVDVYLNGSLLAKGDYTAASNTISGLAALASGDIVEVVVYDIFTVADTVSAKDGGTFSGNVNVDGDLTVDTNTLHVDSTNNRVGINTLTPGAELDIESTGPNIHLNDSDGVLGGAITSRVVMQASGSTHGIVGFGTSGGTMAVTNAQGDLFLQADTNNAKSGSAIKFTVDGSEVMRCTDAGSVFVNTTTGNAQSGTNGGIVLNNVGNGVGRIDVGNTGTCFNGNRSGSHGDIYAVRYQGARRGALMTSSTTGQAVLQGGNVGITFTTNGRLNPTNSSGAASDNAMDLGQSDKRFDDIFATNGNIQTSDQNEKQQIASLTTAEITAAKAISKLFKTFKWNSAVEEKGDAARTHSGVIAQDVQQAMTDAGLDASDYAFFISDTWWETDEVQTDDEGVEHPYKMPYYTADEAPEGATQRTRLGIRYPELLAFVSAATEQRLADIEARLTALEAAE